LARGLGALSIRYFGVGDENVAAPQNGAGFAECAHILIGASPPTLS